MQVRPPEEIVTFFDANLREKRVVLIGNHSAWHCLSEISGKPAQQWVVEYVSDPYKQEQTYDLVWALSSSYRRMNPFTREDLLEYLPATAEGWDELLTKLAKLLASSFFFNQVVPVAIRITEIWMQKHRMIGESIGPEVSTSPAPSESQSETTGTTTISPL